MVLEDMTQETVCLPLPAPDDVQVTYYYRPCMVCPHVFSWRGNSLELSDMELASVPVVARLIEAAEELRDFLAGEETCEIRSTRYTGHFTFGRLYKALEAFE